jgi:hypothetical protein
MEICRHLPWSEAHLAPWLAMLLLPSTCCCRESVAQIDCTESIPDPVRYADSRIDMLDMVVAENDPDKEQGEQGCHCW